MRSIYERSLVFAVIRKLAEQEMAEMKDAGASCNEAKSAKHDSIEIEVIIEDAARK